MAAEMQALANSEDKLHLCRLAWLEFNGIAVDLNHVDEALQDIPGTVIIDAKAIYDVLIIDNQPIQLLRSAGDEKRQDVPMVIE